MKFSCIALVVAAASIVIGATLGETTNAQSDGKAQRPRRPQNREEWYKREGGWVTRFGSGKILRIVNKQVAVPGERITALGVEVQRKIGVVVETAGELPTDGTTGARLELVSEAGAPRLLVAPEDGWAKVNVTALAEDGPDAKTLEERTIKEAWRGIALICGASDSIYQPCLMREIHSLKDLDAVKVLEPSPEAFNMLYRAIDTMRLKRMFTETYRKACEEGWAPAPTNDVQKAIWEKAHAVPATPMKIEFDPKKGR